MKRVISHLYNFQEDGVTAILKGLLEGFFVDNDNRTHPGRAFLLHDEMGLGKTRQALETIKRLREQGHVDAPSLVICPAQVTDIWAQGDRLEHYAQDFEPVTQFCDPTNLNARHLVILSYNTIQINYRHYMQSGLRTGRLSNDELLKFCNIHGASVKRLSSLYGDSYRTELINIAKNVDLKYWDPSNTLKGGTNEFFRQRWGCIVMDEVHFIKNSNSATGKAVAFLNSCFRLGLTGTPIVNAGQDIVNILKFGLNLFDVRWKHLRDNPSGHYCTELLRTFTLGRKKAEIEEIQTILPKRVREDEDVIVPWTSSEHKRTYVQVKEASLAALQEVKNLRKSRNESGWDFNQRRMAVSQNFWTKLQKMRQICLHPELPLYMNDEEEGQLPIKRIVHWNPSTHGQFHPWVRSRLFTFLCCLHRLGHDHVQIRYRLLYHYAMQEQYESPILPSPKMLELVPFLQHKIIVFSTFKRFLTRIMRPWCTHMGYKCALFCGGSKADQRKALEQFEHDPTITILLVVKGAGAVGLNLQRSSHVCFIMDPHFNDATDEQASQRIDRFGQEHEVIVRKLYMQGSVDEALRIMKIQKMDNVHAWLSDSSGKQSHRSLEAQGLYLKKYDTVTWP